MTDRDTFSAAALTGLLANEGEGPILSGTCQYAYRIADAMLAVRDSRTADTANHDAAPASDEIERLRSKLRLQDAVIRSGAVALLTDEEREAVEDAIVLVDYGGCRGDDPKTTLRKLLERLK